MTWEAESVMRFSEIAARLNGISTPIFGLSWQPPGPDVEAAREAIAFLQERGALFGPHVVQDPKYVIESILDIRVEMTRIMAPGRLNAELMSSLRTIRAACRKFTNTLGGHVVSGRLHIPATALGVENVPEIGFNQALGELRGVVGAEVAKMAAAHGLDVEDGLANILPVEDVEPPDDDEPTGMIVEQPRATYVDPPER
jgi:hypothetical protein